MRAGCELPLADDVSVWARPLLIVGISITTFGLLGATVLLVVIYLWDCPPLLMILPVILVISSAPGLLMAVPALLRLKQ
jgi:type IV secretory pathway VirB3-like protein